MRFFSSKNKIPMTSERIKNRWELQSNGLIIDSKRNNNLVWKVDVDSFELFFAGLESRSGQSLGRRLAHSSSESEEWLMIDSKIKPYSGSNPMKWKNMVLDWQERGLGSFELIDNDKDETRILINNPINGPICAGLFSANWEYSTNQRHRFRWNQNTSESLMLSLSIDDLTIPLPKKISSPWAHNLVISSIQDEDYWDTLLADENGEWSIMGVRRAMIHQDLILRFETYFLPYIDEVHEGRKDSYLWEGLDEKYSKLWTIFSDTMREIFFNQGHHIIISKEHDWIGVGRRHLAMNGLGSIDSVKPIDDYGGIEIFFSSCFHPAIFCGVLSGCWERAYGRRVKSEFRIESGTNVIKLISFSEIVRQ